GRPMECASPLPLSSNRMHPGSRRSRTSGRSTPTEPTAHASPTPAPSTPLRSGQPTVGSTSSATAAGRTPSGPPAPTGRDRAPPQLTRAPPVVKTGTLGGPVAGGFMEEANENQDDPSPRRQHGRARACFPANPLRVAGLPAGRLRRRVQREAEAIRHRDAPAPAQ